MPTVFYSWQSTRPTALCRNFIERALQGAIDRLKSDIELEESIREDLSLDRDTKNVSGSPAIFATILEKIAASSVFVADLTFVADREGVGSFSNSNVLLEYGFALNTPGDLRIIAVMNEAYGAPTPETLPFNLRHRRFPLTYSLSEEASNEERRDARRSLVTRFEAASVVSSPPSALDAATLHRARLDHHAACIELRQGQGIVRVRTEVDSLFRAIEAKTREIELETHIGIEAGTPRRTDIIDSSCWAHVRSLRLILNWRQPYDSSLEDAELDIKIWGGIASSPNLAHTVVTDNPLLYKQMIYRPTLSPDLELAWKGGLSRNDDDVIATSELADACLRDLITMLDR